MLLEGVVVDAAVGATELDAPLSELHVGIAPDVIERARLRLALDLVHPDAVVGGPAGARPRGHAGHARTSCGERGGDREASGARSEDGHVGGSAKQHELGGHINHLQTICIMVRLCNVFERRLDRGAPQYAD